MEKWKPINGYEGLYEVSNRGKIKSFHKNKEGILIKLFTEKLKHTNYKCLTLVDIFGNKKQFRVHRIVAEMFLPNKHNKRFVNHIDNNGENNCVENLEWCSQSENIKHSHNQNRSEQVYLANKIQSYKAKKNREDMVGKKYGKWLVLKALPKDYTTKSISKMLCKCECGTEKEVDMISLKNGRSTQCMSCAGKNKGKKKNASII